MIECQRGSPAEQPDGEESEHRGDEPRRPQGLGRNFRQPGQQDVQAIGEHGEHQSFDHQDQCQRGQQGARPYPSPNTWFLARPAYGRMSDMARPT